MQPENRVGTLLTDGADYGKLFPNFPRGEVPSGESKGVTEKMAIKVGINGFGRIGRMVFRAAVENFANDIETCSIPTTSPTC